MQGVYLKFYVQENRRHHGILAYEWLLETARKLGLHGGSAFRAIAGFGRHGRLHEEHFFELAGDLSVEVGFALTEVGPNGAQRPRRQYRRCRNSQPASASVATPISAIGHNWSNTMSNPAPSRKTLRSTTRK